MKKLFYFTIIFLFFGTINFAIGFDTKEPIATGKSYFDTTTGHRYIKNSDNTYNEYSQKGKLLRTDVLNTQPHLSESDRIAEINQDHYMMYEQHKNGELTRQILPASISHPEGWKCKQMMSTVKKPGGRKK
ncbi:MAG: hypothetical protein GY710_20380 [Desulfobacteraceae bacterium]|nr:hypothetical protein [Desulfobacteraceae bacterium]